jgi:ubiquinone/menaquinone biosynthesis C-methylase UbiE
MPAEETPRDAAGQTVLAGHEIYSERVLKIYDPLVLGLTNRFVWRCPRSAMRRLYQHNMGARHLELGAGTGYFLDRVRFPVKCPSVVLMDLNQETLDYASARLARLRPKTVLANVLDPLPVAAGSFDSLAMNMLMHCLPGKGIGDKEAAFENAARALTAGGQVFGSTILAKGVPLTRAAKAMLRSHNERGILSNADDSLADLQSALARNFSDARIWLRGNMALFEATRGED